MLTCKTGILLPSDPQLTFTADLSVSGASEIHRVRFNTPLREINGIALTDAYGSGDNSGVRRYGAWMDHAGFYFYTGVPVVSRSSDTVLQGDQTFIISDVFGKPDPALRRSSQGPDADASYAGAMVGTPPRGHPNHGDIHVGEANITYTNSTGALTIDFATIVNVDNKDRPYRFNMISLASIKPQFNDTYGIHSGVEPEGVQTRIGGQFYGPNQEEIAGWFSHRAMFGVFGAKRQATPDPTEEESASAALTELKRTEAAIAELIADPGFDNTRTAAALAPSGVRFADNTQASFSSTNCGFGGNASAFLCTFQDSDNTSYLLSANLQADDGDRSVELVQQTNDVIVTHLSGAGDNSDIQRYGAWMDSAGFYLYTGVPITTTDENTELADGQTYLIGDYFGSGAANAPEGDATFKGAMVGTPASGQASHGEVLAGDADVTYQISNGGVTIDFSDIVNLSQDGAVYGSGTLSLSALQPRYQAGTGLVSGATPGALSGDFYGPDGSEEIVGRFSHTIDGVFGAKRVQE